MQHDLHKGMLTNMTSPPHSAVVQTETPRKQGFLKTCVMCNNETEQRTNSITTCELHVTVIPERAGYVISVLFKY